MVPRGSVKLQPSGRCRRDETGLARRLPRIRIEQLEVTGERVLALRHRYPATAEAVSVARRAVAHCAEGLDAGDSVKEAIALAVTEACANVVVHAYRDQPDVGEMTVSLEWSSDCLRAYVADDGIGMAPRLDSPGLGLGIPLISQLTDGFELRSRPEGGTEVCMQFTLSTKVAA